MARSDVAPDCVRIQVSVEASNSVTKNMQNIAFESLSTPDGGACIGYSSPGGFLEQRGYLVVVNSTEASHNEADAQRPWEVSEQLTGVRFL